METDNENEVTKPGQHKYPGVKSFSIKVADTVRNQFELQQEEYSKQQNLPAFTRADYLQVLLNHSQQPAQQPAPQHEDTAQRFIVDLTESEYGEKFSEELERATKTTGFSYGKVLIGVTDDTLKKVVELSNQLEISEKEAERLRNELADLKENTPPPFSLPPNAVIVPFDEKTIKMLKACKQAIFEECAEMKQVDISQLTDEEAAGYAVQISIQQYLSTRHFTTLKRANITP